MKINITFNGNDGCGKTTQFNVMKKEYGDFIYFANDISTFNIFPNKQGDDFFEWWFFDSDLKDFAEIIYKGIFLQKEQIEKCDKKLIITDKGILTFDARIMANFLTRGYKINTIQSVLDELKVRYLNFENHKDVDLFFLVNDDLIKKRIENRKENDDNNSYNEYYNLYQNNLKKIMLEQVKKGKYLLIDAESTVADTTFVLEEVICDISENNDINIKKYCLR